MDIGQVIQDPVGTANFDLICVPGKSLEVLKQEGDLFMFVKYSDHSRQE
jgi:hypothetical protein